jgi:hypothetical protein
MCNPAGNCRVIYAAFRIKSGLSGSSLVPILRVGAVNLKKNGVNAICKIFLEDKGFSKVISDDTKLHI